jgi:hypothetical protein
MVGVGAYRREVGNKAGDRSRKRSGSQQAVVQMSNLCAAHIVDVAQGTLDAVAIG